MSSFRVRVAAPGDQSAILSCFHRVFGVQRDREHWEWQYNSSPGAPGVVSVAEADGAVVGAVGLMRQDLNRAGERIPAGQACDGMLDVEHRGSRGFTALSRSTYEAGGAAGIRLLLAFPNHNSFPSCIRLLNYRRVGTLRYYYRRLGIRGLAGAAGDRLARAAARIHNSVAFRTLRWRIGRHLEVQSTNQLPDDLAALVRANHAKEVYSVWKDEEYLRWRYERHPGRRYEFHVLRDQGAAIAMAVCTKRMGVVALCDLLHAGRSPREIGFLLRKVVGRYATEPVQLIEFYGFDRGFFEVSFKEAGFRSEAYSAFQLLVRCVESDGPQWSDAFMPHNWTICYGDTDVI